jgi:adenylylsulfate kinase-like enzyme
MLIVISGPIASGKSTVARALARNLGHDGVTAATIDLDVVCDMLEHKGALEREAANWVHARRAVASLAKGFLGDGIDVAIVDGDFLQSTARAELLAAVKPIKPRFVTLYASFDIALRRVHDDPTRGLSREPTFLRRHFDAAEAALRDVPATDLALDTESITAAEAARTIADWALTASPCP